jgi:hypothetical protein
MSRKPDFFIVGAAKSGTTSLYNYLRQHPKVSMPVEKEPHFFGEWRQSVSDRDFAEYLRLFRGVPEDVVAGEASTTYLYLENVAEQIKQFQPRAKIIIILRNPIDRAYSQYWHNVRQGHVSQSFEEELEEEIHSRESRECWSGFRPGVLPPVYYIKIGKYAEQVTHFMEIFGEDSVRVYLFDDLIKDPESVCRDAFMFLGVDSNHPIDAGLRYNVSGPVRNPLLAKLVVDRSRTKEAIKKVLPITWLRAVREWALQKNTGTVPKMDPETRRRLQHVFKDDILYVQELTERDLSHWLGDSGATVAQKDDRRKSG